ncbi:Cyclin, variant 2 [Balamuthia mandrillaris]
MNESPAERLRKQRVVDVLAKVLERLVASNDQLPCTIKTIFHAQRPPSISVTQYLQRILTYAPCSYECFVLALVYIDRIVQYRPEFQVNSLNIHRLLITSILLAAKFFDDCYYNNAFYAKVGGVSGKEMNRMEMEFLYLINFSLSFTADTFHRYDRELAKHSKIIVDANVPRSIATKQEMQPRVATVPVSCVGPVHIQALTAACCQLLEEEVRAKKLSPVILSRATELIQKVCFTLSLLLFCSFIDSFCSLSSGNKGHEIHIADDR